MAKRWRIELVAGLRDPAKGRWDITVDTGTTMLRFSESITASAVGAETMIRHMLNKSPDLSPADVESLTTAILALIPDTAVK